MRLKEILKQKQKLINKELRKYLSPKYLKAPDILANAVKYSVFSGGKRFRSSLALMTAEALGKKSDKILPAACAIELIHNFSLVHDDLPCMDNDDYRRGRLTTHKKFNESTALLAGDALLTHAFKIIADNYARADAKSVLKITAELADATGKMISGQIKELELKPDQIDDAALNYVHLHKTGALIRCAVRTGAILAGASSRQLNNLTQYGQDIGLIFQITDDILDMNVQDDRLNFTSFYGLSETKKIANNLADSAIKSLKNFGKHADNLREIVYYLLSRKL